MIAFFNAFFNQVVLLVVFAAVSAVGACLGVMARKKKDASQPAGEVKKN
jgi:ABC-type Na+ efflux pump permease subunit